MRGVTPLPFTAGCYLDVMLVRREHYTQRADRISYTSWRGERDTYSFSVFTSLLAGSYGVNVCQCVYVCV